MRVETLTESRPKTLDLSVETAQALVRVGRTLASTKRWWGDDAPPETRSAVWCVPVASGGWRVTVANAVGLIAVGGLQLVVEPKIPPDHLWYLFAQSRQFPRVAAARARAAPGAHLWELVAAWFLLATEQLLRGGLARDYQLITDELPAIRGHAEPLTMADAVYRGRLTFPCEFDEFSEDTPLNRLLKAAARVIASSPLLSPELRKRALALLAHMEDVGDAQPGDGRAGLERRTGHYADATSLARHVLNGQGRTLTDGEIVVHTFLLPTPPLVEEGIRALLAARLHRRWGVLKQSFQLTGTRHTVTPDLVFGQRLAVADVKYKLLRDAWNRPDLYQVVAFATALRSRHGALIGFRTPDTPPQPPLTFGDTRIVELTWTADAGTAPEVAAQRLALATTDWVAEGDA